LRFPTGIQDSSTTATDAPRAAAATSAAAIAGTLYAAKLTTIRRRFAEIVKMPNRGRALAIDYGWREVAETALDFVKRFT
jgi:hypothetical protein